MVFAHTVSWSSHKMLTIIHRMVPAEYLMASAAVGCSTTRKISAIVTVMASHFAVSRSRHGIILLLRQCPVGRTQLLLPYCIAEIRHKIVSNAYSPRVALQNVLQPVEVLRLMDTQSDMKHYFAVYARHMIARCLHRSKFPRSVEMIAPSFFKM